MICDDKRAQSFRDEEKGLISFSEVVKKLSMESERRSTVILSAEKGMNAYLQVLPPINTLLKRGKVLRTLDNDSC